MTATCITSYDFRSYLASNKKGVYPQLERRSDVNGLGTSSQTLLEYKSINKKHTCTFLSIIADMRTAIGFWWAWSHPERRRVHNKPVDHGAGKEHGGIVSSTRSFRARF